MGIAEWQKILDDSGIHTFYPITFKAQTEESSIFQLTGGTPERGGVYTNYLRILTRERHPVEAERIIKDTRKYLYSNVKGAFFNGEKVINIESDTVEPLFIGEENGLYIFSINYTIIMG